MVVCLNVSPHMVPNSATAPKYVWCLSSRAIGIGKLRGDARGVGSSGDVILVKKRASLRELRRNLTEPVAPAIRGDVMIWSPMVTSDAFGIGGVRRSEWSVKCVETTTALNGALDGDEVTSGSLVGLAYNIQCRCVWNPFYRPQVSALSNTRPCKFVGRKRLVMV